MAVTPLTNAYIELNSVDRSDQVHSVSLPFNIEELDVTTFGDTTMLNEPGLKSFSADLEFYNDFTDDEEDEDLFALWNNRTKFTVKIRPSATAVGAGNPSYEFTGFISSWNPVQGSVGEIAGGSMTISNTTSLTRATS